MASDKSGAFTGQQVDAGNVEDTNILVSEDQIVMSPNGEASWEQYHCQTPTHAEIANQKQGDNNHTVKLWVIATGDDDTRTSDERYAHVQCMLQDLPGELTQDQKHVAKDLVENYSDVFSTSEFDVGKTNLMVHEIDTGNKPPFKQQLRRHPKAHLDIIDKHVEEMVKRGVVLPCISPYSSNVCLVRKKDNSIRFCVDLRQLNEQVVRDNYGAPRVDACLDALEIGRAHV